MSAPERETAIEWAVLSDYALIDNAGKLSVLGIFSELFADSFPVIHPLMFVTAKWQGIPATIVNAELRLWGPGQDLMFTAQQQIQTDPMGSGVGIIRLPPLPLPQAGSYTFEFFADGVSLRHLPLNVRTPPVAGTPEGVGNGES